MKKFERQAQSQRKHGPPSVSSASKAPARPPSSRPGWTGPGYVKKAARKPRPASAPSAVAPTIQEHLLPVELQQNILDIFRDTFPASHDFAALKPLLQHINDALLQGDVESVFEKEECLEGYAIRWSPSRALGCSNLLAEICEQRRDDLWVRRLIGDGEETPAKIVCFGGGAAELMAFAGLLRLVRKDAAGQPTAASSSCTTGALEGLDMPSSGPGTPITIVDLFLVDLVDWSPITSKLRAGLTNPPALSKYASASARARNASLLSPEAIALTSSRADVLDLSLEDLGGKIGPEPTLLTLFFTLNDLYTTSIQKTTAFLRKLTKVVPQGSLLLVVDSPEAATTVAVTKTEEETKEYSMSWLLENTLLPTRVPKEPKEDGMEKPAPSWERLIDDTNRLYRLPDKGLSYPASLENLKLQVHLFRRL